MRDDVAEAGRALVEGLRFTRDAWRSAWIPLLICTAGAAALLAADRLGLPSGAVQALRASGLSLMAVGWGPKLGALHRSALGRGPAAQLSAGGLQMGRTEWRLFATCIALAGLAAVVAVLLTGIVIVVLAVLRPLGAVELAPGFRLGVGFLLASPLLALLASAALSAVGRFCVTLSADAAETSPRFARGWLLTRGRPLAPALVLLATTVLPLGVLFGLLAVLDDLAKAGGDPWSRGPPLDALAAAVVTAALSQFVFAPLNSGALASLYRAGLLREAGAKAVRAPSAANDNEPSAVADTSPAAYSAAKAQPPSRATPSDPPAA